VAAVVLNPCIRWKRAISFNTTDVSTAGEGYSQNLLSGRVAVPAAGVCVVEKRKSFGPKMRTALMHGIQQTFRIFFRNVVTNIENCFFFCAIMQQVVMIYLRVKSNMMRCLFSVYFVNQPLHLFDVLLTVHTHIIHIKPLKTKRRPLYLKTQPVPRCKHFSLGYKNQSVYAVSDISRCLFSDKYKTRKYSVGTASSCWMLNWWCIT